MSFIVLDDGTDRARWLDARRPVVTATDVARLARGGANTWAAIRAEKAGYARNFDTSAMQHGREREPFIARYAGAAFGLEPCGALLAAADRPEYAATPDLLGDEEVGEAKTTVHDWTSLAEVPGRYIDQNLWQQRVTGRKRGRLVFEPHENGIPVYPFPKDFVIERDEARIRELEAVADEFLAGNPDEWSEEDAALDALLTEYAEYAELAGAWSKRADRAKAAIEELLGGQARRFEGSVANLSRAKDGFSQRFDQSALRAADPDTFARFVKPSPVKGRLTITLRSAA